MKKLLSILGSIGLVATAGTLVVSCKDEKKDTNQAQKLHDLVGKAERSLSESNKAAEAKNVLRPEIAEAKKVDEKLNPNNEEIKVAVEKLQTAFDVFNKTTDLKDMPLLKEKVSSAELLLTESTKKEEAKTALKTAVEEAKKVSESTYGAATFSTPEEVSAATEKLHAAIVTFNDSPSIPSTTKLAAQIEVAKTAITSSKLGAEDTNVVTLSAAITKAEEVLKATDNTQTTIDEATNTLGAAVKAFKEATDVEAILVEKEEVTVAAKAVETVKITNADKISDLKAESDNVEVATVIVAEGVITITGVTKGEANLTISGANVKNTVTIKATVTEATKTDVKDVIKTTALGELENKEAETIRQAVIAKNATAKDATFNVESIGDTKATIAGTGEYTGTVEVTFTVKASNKIDIVLDWDRPSMTVGETFRIGITNFKELKDVKVEGNDSTIATAELIDDGITLKGVKIGTTELKVTGSNANTKTFTIKVVAE